MKWLWMLLIALAACGLAPVPTPTPSPTPPPGWQVIAPGLELGSVGPSAAPLGQLWVLRIDPALYGFRVHDQTPQRLDSWQESLPEAVAFVNASFFTPEYDPIGLLVADGVARGTPMEGQGGSFVVRSGQPRILSNVYEPDLGANLEQVVQTFPLLLYSGQRLYKASAQERVTRRSVIAQDGQGRILIMATPLIGLSLDRLAQFLLESDLGIVDALNLDGGGSTMLYVQTGASALRLMSLDAVPVVLAIYPR